MKRLAAAGLLLLLCACSSAPRQTEQPRLPLPAPPPTGEPGDLVNMSASQLRGQFGTPAFQRKEYGSEMWRYDIGQCRIFFFLYPGGSDMVVRHVETLPHSKATATDPGCLTALRGKPASPLS